MPQTPRRPNGTGVPMDSIAVTVRFPPDLHEAFKLRCVKLGTDMSAYLRGAARDLSKQPLGGVKRP